jgi:hypothetical protein
VQLQRNPTVPPSYGLPRTNSKRNTSRKRQFFTLNVSVSYFRLPIDKKCVLINKQRTDLFVYDHSRQGLRSRSSRLVSSYSLNSYISWDTTVCLLLTSYRVRVWFTLSNAEDGGDILLRRFGWQSTDYMVLYPRTLHNHCRENLKFYNSHFVSQLKFNNR